MHHDAIIIGGSFAGLSAAMYVGRARRSAVIVDAGAPRNRFAARSHGFFGQDGQSPGAMLATARAQVLAYPTISTVENVATLAERDGDGFRVTLADGAVLHGSRLVLAFGISDILPDVPGVAERWGASVLHCPYCHGFEFAERRLGVLYSQPMSLHQARLIPEWGPTTFFLNGAEVDAAELGGLRARGVRIEPRAVAALRGEGTSLEALELADGTLVPLDALYVGPRTRMNSDVAEQLGCAMDDGMMGPIIRVDAQQQTSVPGVFAAGDITRSGHTVTFASADGVMAGLAVHRSLVFPA